eukprot:7050706-Prymnesium_polylepis.1
MRLLARRQTGPLSRPSQYPKPVREPTVNPTLHRTTSRDRTAHACETHAATTHGRSPRDEEAVLAVDDGARRRHVGLDDLVEHALRANVRLHRALDVPCSSDARAKM